MVKRKTRIKIKDLPRDIKVRKEEMKKVLGGSTPFPFKFQLTKVPGPLTLPPPEEWPWVLT